MTKATLNPVRLEELVSRLRAAAREAGRLKSRWAPGRLQGELVGIAAELDSLRALLATLIDLDQDGAERRVNHKNPGPGLRRCSQCREVLSVSMFAFSDRSTSKLRADCKKCYNARQRHRYVRVGQQVVTVEVLDEDPCVGYPCPGCGSPFVPGQLVRAGDLCHAQCSELEGSLRALSARLAT